MKHSFAALGLVAMLALSACTSPSTNVRPIDLSFSQLQPVTLNVGAVQVLNTSAPSTAAKGIALKNASPAAALERYVRQRLHASGGEGTLNFVIQQATLTSNEVTPTGGDWTDNLHLGKPTEHTVTMRVGLDLVGRATQPNMKSAYTLERKKTISAGSSLVQRDREINKLIEGMVYDMDKAVIRGLKDNMRIMVTPGAITFGTPTDLETPVAPPELYAQPQVIQH